MVNKIKDKNSDSASSKVELAQVANEKTPQVDIIEENDFIKVICNMPLVDKDKIDIRFENRELTITGWQNEFNHNGLKVVNSEFNYGVFKRVFDVSAEIDYDSISAQYKNGVLTITLPRREQAKVKKIPIMSK
ncbi:Hsp20/alpha crystallin family protein [Lentisphaerota bacterium ZTH]|nr:Hsp20/alpha crystallin family protein [Lentisphaerota bacterium]WET05824.1 Hsp20/alpha crystallin family protein [Lentisphaerota bacterium ZTH]